MSGPGLPVRALVGLAVVCFALQIAPLPYPPPFGTDADLRAHVEAANQVYGYGSFVDALKFRAEEVRPMGLLLGAAIVLTARPLRGLAPLGRMAFTCYLAQSLILSGVFYGWGLAAIACELPRGSARARNAYRVGTYS